MAGLLDMLSSMRHTLGNQAYDRSTRQWWRQPDRPRVGPFPDSGVPTTVPGLLNGVGAAPQGPVGILPEQMPSQRVNEAFGQLPQAMPPGLAQLGANMTDAEWIALIRDALRR